MTLDRKRQYLGKNTKFQDSIGHHCRILASCLFNNFPDQASRSEKFLKQHRSVKAQRNVVCSPPVDVCKTNFVILIACRRLLQDKLVYYLSHRLLCSFSQRMRNGKTRTTQLITQNVNTTSVVCKYTGDGSSTLSIILKVCYHCKSFLFLCIISQVNFDTYNPKAVAYVSVNLLNHPNRQLTLESLLIPYQSLKYKI